MSKKADKFIEKYIVGKDDWLLKHKEVISKLLDEYETEQLTLTDVVSTYHCESYDFKRQGRRCAKQCDSCEWMEKKQ